MVKDKPRRKKEELLYKIRHSLAHVMAAAVGDMYPDTKFGIGPVIENGFFYDFDLKHSLSEDDLPRIEKKMRALIAKKLPIEHLYITLAKATKDAKMHGQKYKMELLKEIGAGKRLGGEDNDAQLKNGKISFYKIGVFTDLCKGPHVNNTGDIPKDGFKLTHLAGAYWRGDEKNPQMQRIYGIAFETKKERDQYLREQEEAKKRDHRVIGKKLELFTFHNLIGSGLPILLPRGTIIKEEIEKFAKETEYQAGYQRIVTPHIGKEDLFKTSGHLPYYADSMFPPMKLDDGNFYLKAMNCPFTHLAYKSKPRSYRDLPLRFAEYGTVYRNELSGTLAGLLRVRMLSMNDAHIYCMKEQVEREFKEVMSMTLRYFKLFGLTDYWFRLSKWDPKKKEKYINEPKNWMATERTLRKVLKELGVSFEEADGEAAFYGPKVDVQYKFAGGREETFATIQLDFAAKKRFHLTYHDKDGKEKEEVFVIHRAPLSTHERFIALLIELYAGAFPVWLSPVQTAILPIGKAHKKYAQKVCQILKDQRVRVELSDTDETIGKRIREAEVQKIPYILIVGEKEVRQKQVAVRERGKGDQGTIPIQLFVDKIKEEIRNKK